MGKIAVVLGTRPEIIKLASVVKGLQKTKHDIVVINTGQHKQLGKQTLKIFDIKPNYDLKIMKKNQTLCDIVKKSISGLDEIIKKERPDLMIVLGDTATALSGAQSAFYNNVKIMHLEAGVRAETKNLPFPEEANRRMITQISDYNVSIYKEHKDNLKKEGISAILSGNTGIDALKMIKVSKKKKNQILFTMHRRENWDKVEDMCDLINELAFSTAGWNFIVACHPNPIVRDTVYRKLSFNSLIKIIDSVPYDKFVQLIAESKLIVTDSGGIPQEAPIFNTTVLITRNQYENAEILKLTDTKIVGTNTEEIKSAILKEMTKKKKSKNYKNYSKETKSYKKIIKYVEEILK